MSDLIHSTSWSHADKLTDFNILIVTDTKQSDQSLEHA